MKHIPFLLPMLACTLTLPSLDACSSSTDPGTKSPADTTVTYDKGDSTRPPSAKRLYDGARGGVQITAIFYDQALNESATGLLDEWVIIQTTRPVRTAGWWLNAGDDGQNYVLPDTISGSLTVYTHDGPTNPTGATMALHLNPVRWIWNNKDPDTARVYDDKDSVVSTFIYDVR